MYIAKPIPINSKTKERLRESEPFSLPLSLDGKLRLEQLQPQRVGKPHQNEVNEECVPNENAFDDRVLMPRHDEKKHWESTFLVSWTSHQSDGEG